jgi:hypothetical protein
MYEGFNQDQTLVSPSGAQLGPTEFLVKYFATTNLHRVFNITNLLYFCLECFFLGKLYARDAHPKI